MHTTITAPQLHQELAPEIKDEVGFYTDTDQVRAYAIQAHGNQMYGKQPYHVHLDGVAFLVSTFGEVAEKLALLHDVGEDTDKTHKDLATRFG
jgi:(p)ppGpp synthase/HD superfamily hydrolase